MGRHGSRSKLIGNRIMLTGVVLYLLEWVAIIGTGSSGADPRKLTAVIGRSAADTVTSYQGREDALAFMAGWFSVVVLGRILLIVGLKASLAVSDRPHPLMDFAVAAMTVSVVIEITAYGLVAAAARLGAAHPEGIVAIEWSAGILTRKLSGGAVGVALLCSAWAMWASGLFPMALNILAIIAGAGLTSAPMFFAAPSFETVANILEISAFVFFAWMLWAGVLLWRRTPKQTAALAFRSPAHSS